MVGADVSAARTKTPFLSPSPVQLRSRADSVSLDGLTHPTKGSPTPLTMCVSAVHTRQSFRSNQGAGWFQNSDQMRCNCSWSPADLIADLRDGEKKLNTNGVSQRGTVANNGATHSRHWHPGVSLVGFQQNRAKCHHARGGVQRLDDIQSKGLLERKLPGTFDFDCVRDLALATS